MCVFFSTREEKQKLDTQNLRLQTFHRHDSNDKWDWLSAACFYRWDIDIGTLFESALKSMKCHECVIILNTVKNIERINLAVITNAWNKPNNKRLIELLSTRWCYLLSSNHYATILWQLIIHCIKLWRLENWEWNFFFYSYLGGHCPCKWEVKTSTWEHGIAHSERIMSSTFAFHIFDFRANN